MSPDSILIKHRSTHASRFCAMKFSCNKSNGIKWAVVQYTRGLLANALELVLYRGRSRSDFRAVRKKADWQFKQLFCVLRIEIVGASVRKLV